MLSSRVSCHRARHPSVWPVRTELCVAWAVQEPNGPPVQWTRNASVTVASGPPVAIPCEDQSAARPFRRGLARSAAYGIRRHATNAASSPHAKARSPVRGLVAWGSRRCPLHVPCHGLPREGRHGTGTPGRLSLAVHGRPSSIGVGDVDVPACGRVSGPYRQETRPCGDVNGRIRVRDAVPARTTSIGPACSRLLCMWCPSLESEPGRRSGDVRPPATRSDRCARCRFCRCPYYLATTWWLVAEMLSRIRLLSRVCKREIE